MARGRVTSDLRQLTSSQLRRWLEARTLDPALHEALVSVVAQWERAKRLELEQQRIEAERQASIDLQARITEQLSVLRDVGDEGALRHRHVIELGAEQDKVRKLEDEIRALSEEAARLRKKGDEGMQQVLRGS